MTIPTKKWDWKMWPWTIPVFDKNIDWGEVCTHFATYYVSASKRNLDCARIYDKVVELNVNLDSYTASKTFEHYFGYGKGTHTLVKIEMYVTGEMGKIAELLRYIDSINEW